MKIGITGHQRLDDPTAWSWVAAAVERELDRAPAPLVAVTSLAIGADQLLARLTLARGGTVHAVLPFRDIERSFAAEDLAAFRNLVARSNVEVLATPGIDEDAYLAAGKRVVELSDRILAVWDGEPAKGRGGTAEIVAYAAGRGLPIVHINPATRTVRWPEVAPAPTLPTA
jgi:hypothetical protein